MQNNTVYIDILPKIHASSNNSKNRSIGMTSNQARKPENYGGVYWNLYGDGWMRESSVSAAHLIKDILLIGQKKSSL